MDEQCLSRDEDPLAKAAAAAILGLASWARGDLEAAHDEYATSSEVFRRAGHWSDVLACAIFLADIRIAQGRLAEALSDLERALLVVRSEHGERTPVVRGTSDIYVAMSEVHRERGEFEAARQRLRASQQLGEQNGLPQHRYRSRVAMARAQEAEGDLDGAVALLDEAELHYVADSAPNVRPVSAMRARLLVKQGQLDAAFAWARERGLSVDGELSHLREFEHMTLARMLISRGTSARGENDLRSAERLLGHLLRAADEGGRAGTVLEAHILLALAMQARGDTTRALIPFQRALHLAAPERHVHYFLNDGLSLAALLRAASAAGLVPASIGRLLVGRAETSQVGPASASGTTP